MPGHYAPHVPGYAYTTSQPSTSHATNTSYDSAPNTSMTDAARSEPPSVSLGFHSEAMSGYPSRSLPTQHTSNSSSFARHFQHYDQIPLSGNYGHLDPAAAQHHDHIGQSTLSFPQSAAISPVDGHELQNAFLNDSMAPPGTVMPASSEHIDPMTTRPLMRTSPPISTISKRPRQDSLSQSDSVKRARTSDRVRAPGSSLPYPDDAWELSAFSMSSQQSRTLSRPTSELSGVNSPFHPDNRGSSGLNPGPQFLASPPSDRPQSANSLPQSPEIHTMNGIAQGIPGAGFRPFASPQRRFSNTSSHTFVPPSIPDGPTSQSPTLPGHPTPGGVSPYYTPPSSGLRPSTGTASASSFASTSRLGAPDALVTTSSDDGSSNVSHSLGETEMIASFPQFYERVRALCLKFNDDAANLLRATPHDVLAQSFQMGTGSDPMRMLNDAKAICERMMNADSSTRARVPSSSHLEGTMLHGLSYPTSAYPPPFHSHWSPRLPSSSHSATPSGADEEYFQLPKGYGSDPTIQRDLALARPPSVDVSFNNSTLRSAANVNHGTWRDEESEKLRQLAEHSRATSKLNGQDKIDWDWVVERFGASRTRHQILIKATHLGLKPTSTHPSRIRKRLAKAEAAAAAAAQAATSPGSSAPPATQAANPVHQDAMTSPSSAPRHYPPHVLNQTVDTRPKSGETLQTTTSNSDSIPPYEPGGSA